MEEIKEVDGFEYDAGVEPTDEDIAEAERMAAEEAEE